MKIYKHGKLACLLLCLCLFFIGAVTVNAGTNTVAVTLTKAGKLKNKTIKSGTSADIRVKYKSILLYNDYVTFSSSNPSVATVSENGVLNTKRAGSSIITASYKKYKARVRLKVQKGSAQQTAQSQQSQDTLTSGSTGTISSIRQEVVRYASSFVGVLRYVYGGDSLKTGTDCSGFIHLIMAHFGVSVPRSASEFQRMSNIRYDQLQPGDIVCYKYGGHVALYIGNDTVVHAKGAAYGTCRDSMWYGTPTGYVRVLK